MPSSKQLLFEIDETLDQLIKNAEKIETIADGYEEEIYALHKMQVSLLAHLIDLHENGQVLPVIAKLKKAKSKFCLRNPSHKRAPLKPPFRTRRKKVL